MATDIPASPQADDKRLPAGSRIEIERFPGGLTVKLPPAGIRGTKGLLFMAVIWLAVTSVLSPVFILPLFDVNNKQDGATIALPILLSVFWLVGVGLLLAALNMARRQAVFAVTGGTLMVLQTGIFGSKQRDFEPGDVESILVGPSGMTVNDKPVLELQIVDGGGQRLCLLAGRDEKELDWLAHELTAALHPPPSDEI